MADTMIESARVDLVIINTLLTHVVANEDMVLSGVGYHLQQLVEKSLKAVLEITGEDYRAYGHSIGKCLRGVMNHAPGALSADTFQRLQPYISLLTDWESAGRYPSDFVFLLKEIKTVQVIATDVFQECLAYITSRSKNDSGSNSIGTMDLFKR